MRLIVVATLAALLVGLVGGLLGYEALFQAAQGVFVVGLFVLCVWALWRRRDVAVGVDEEIGGERPPLNIRMAEDELRRKNRGTEPIAK
jgi:hypothetical protein